MRFRNLSFLAAILTVLALAVPALANPETVFVTLHEPGKLVDAYLKSGSYRLKIDGSTVVVLKDRKVIAEVQGEWVQTEAKASADSVVKRGDQIIEFRFRGKDRVLRFQ
jgi:hypothetical protein